LNWYDTRTLEPLAPAVLSSVDSGNLLASLWTLQQGCWTGETAGLAALSGGGFLDYLRVLAAERVLPRKAVTTCERERDTGNWLQCVLNFPKQAMEQRIRVQSQACRC